MKDKYRFLLSSAIILSMLACGTSEAIANPTATPPSPEPTPVPTNTPVPLLLVYAWGLVNQKIPPADWETYKMVLVSCLETGQIDNVCNDLSDIALEGMFLRIQYMKNGARVTLVTDQQGFAIDVQPLNEVADVIQKPDGGARVSINYQHLVEPGIISIQMPDSSVQRACIGRSTRKVDATKTVYTFPYSVSNCTRNDFHGRNSPNSAVVMSRQLRQKGAKF